MAQDDLNLENSTTTNNPEKKESTVVDKMTGDYVVPPFQSLQNYKDVGKNTDPQVCKVGRQRHPANIRVKFHGESEHRNYCNVHFARENFDPESHGTPMMIGNDSKGNSDIRAADAIAAALARANAAKDVHEGGGVAPIVQGRGRPVRGETKLTDATLTDQGSDPMATDEKKIKRGTGKSLQDQANAILNSNPVEDTINLAAESGGRNQGPEHDSKVDIAHKAVLHGVKIGGGKLEMTGYHYMANKLGMTDEGERLKYLDWGIGRANRPD
jgi:hypothetical protein